MSGIYASLSQRGSQSQVKADDRHELAVLTRKSDNEGWSDKEFTAALQELAEKRKNTTTTPSSSPLLSPKISTTASLSQNKLIDVEKRQETVRITRQADSEGWSDDKTLAALRLRNSIHHELREKVRPISDLSGPTESQISHATT